MHVWQPSDGRSYSTGHGFRHDRVKDSASSRVVRFLYCGITFVDCFYNSLGDQGIGRKAFLVRYSQCPQSSQGIFAKEAQCFQTIVDSVVPTSEGLFVLSTLRRNTIGRNSCRASRATQACFAMKDQQEF